MNIYIMIAILLANIVAITIVYQFIKKLSKKEQIIFLAISIAITYILISIAYWFSGFGIDEKVHQSSKDFVTYMFVPVNVILFIPFIASNYMKLKYKKIEKEVFAKKCTTVVIIALIVLVGEYFYFRNMQQNIISISDDVKNTNQTIQNETIENRTTENEGKENQNVENTAVNEQGKVLNYIANEQID